MPNFKIFRRILVLFLCLLQMTAPVFAAEDSQALKQEVQELKENVKKLTELIEKQNERISELEGKKASRSAKQEIKPLPVTEEKQSPKLSEKSETVKDESQALLDQVNNATPTPGANTKSVGLWRYPTGNSTAAKILPDISVIGSFAGSYFERDPMGDNTGSVGADPASTGFTFQELELSLQGVIDPYFRYDAFLSFNQEGVEIEEAYFTTQSGLPKGLQFKGGIMLLPFGRQNPKHLHAWTFADNNLANKYLLGADGLGEVGLQMSYLFPTPFFLQFQSTVTNGDNSNSFGGTQAKDFLYNGRLSASTDLTDTLTLLFGGSFAWGYNATAPGNYTAIYGGDFLLKWKPSANTSLSWQTEYIGRKMQVTAEDLTNAITDGGLYSYIDWQFFKRWHAAFRLDQMGLPVGLQPRETRLTPAIAFNPTEFSQIRLQYEADKLTGEDWASAVILQLMFTLGAHGAHLF